MTRVPDGNLQMTVKKFRLSLNTGHLGGGWGLFFLGFFVVVAGVCVISHCRLGYLGWVYQTGKALHRLVLHHCRAVMPAPSLTKAVASTFIVSGDTGEHRPAQATKEAAQGPLCLWSVPSPLFVMHQWHECQVPDSSPTQSQREAVSLGVFKDKPFVHMGLQWHGPCTP